MSSKNNLIIFTLVIISSIETIKTASPPQPVTINKCCRIGETLELNNNGLPSCTVGSSVKWMPKVYLIKRKIFYEPNGDIPKHMTINENTFPKTCVNPEYITGKHKFVILSDGLLFLSEKSKSITTTNYCTENESALICIGKIGDGERKLSTVKKCCGPHSIYDETNSTCFNLNKEHKLFNRQILNTTNIEFNYGFPDCETHNYALAGKYLEGSVNENTGILNIDNEKNLEWTEYCLEFTYKEYKPYVNIFTCSEHFKTPEPSLPVPQNDIRFALYSVGLLISVIFLFATLAAGFLVPSNHHVLHWRCQTHYVACLLVGDFLLAMTQLIGNSITGPFCIVIAIFMHFFFLAAFFWLNTMCFNIWWTFRDFRPTSMEKGQELCRLRIYEVYAWGVPLLIAGVAVILDNLPESADDTFLRPRFGENKCWFYGDMEILTYFYGPIGILLFINLLLFASTARQLTCGLWKRDDVKSTTERAALGRVCLKLVVVMGVTWMADVISWAVGGPTYLWIVTDLVNALQGVLIFIVVGCQPQVWSAIKRFWTSKTGRGVNTTTHGPQHSSSSHGLPSMGDSVTNNTFTNTSTKIPMETIC